MLQKIIILVVLLPFVAIFYGLMFRGGEKIGEKKLKFIKNKHWRDWFGLIVLIIIVYGIGAIILNFL